MKVTVEIEVEPLPEDRFLAFHQEVGTVYIDDKAFTLTRNISATGYGLHREVDGITVIHTVDLNPVIQAAVTAILTGETTE